MKSKLNAVAKQGLALAVLTWLPGCAEPAPQQDPQTGQDVQAAQEVEAAQDVQAPAASTSSAGHEIPKHRFNDAEKWAAKFEDPERDAWQRPDYVLEMLALDPTAKVADIGSATGYFPVRFARAVPQGVVYGLDVEPAMVQYLNERAIREGLTNIESIEATADDPKIPEPVDLIFLCNTYHHIPNRIEYFRNRLADLLPGGRLAIVDFMMGDLPQGPPNRHKLSEVTVTNELREAGYRLIYIDDWLPYQYFLIFTPEE